jgi:hypothetical protein
MCLKEIGWKDMDWVHFAENSYLSHFGAENFNCLLKGKVVPVLNKLSII